MFDALSFGSFVEIAPRIVEITVHEGVEIDEAKILLIETAVLSAFSDPYALLVNRANTCSHTHGSMLAVSRLKNPAGIAILVYSDFSRHSAEIHTLYDENVRVFDNHLDALNWLQGRLEKA